MKKMKPILAVIFAIMCSGCGSPSLIESRNKTVKRDTNSRLFLEAFSSRYSERIDSIYLQSLKTDESVRVAIYGGPSYNGYFLYVEKAEEALQFCSVESEYRTHIPKPESVEKVKGIVMDGTTMITTRFKNGMYYSKKIYGIPLSFQKVLHGHNCIELVQAEAP